MKSTALIDLRVYCNECRFWFRRARSIENSGAEFSFVTYVVLTKTSFLSSLLPSNFNLSLCWNCFCSLPNKNQTHNHGNEKGRTCMQTSPATRANISNVAFAYIKNQKCKDISDHIIVNSAMNSPFRDSINEKPLVARAFLVILI